MTQLWIKWYVETERRNTRGGATKKRDISRNLLSRNLHFSVECFARSVTPDPIVYSFAPNRAALETNNNTE